MYSNTLGLLWMFHSLWGLPGRVKLPYWLPCRAALGCVWVALPWFFGQLLVLFLIASLLLGAFSTVLVFTAANVRWLYEATESVMFKTPSLKFSGVFTRVVLVQIVFSDQSYYILLVNLLHIGNIMKITNEQGLVCVLSVLGYSWVSILLNKSWFVEQVSVMRCRRGLMSTNLTVKTTPWS